MSGLFKAFKTSHNKESEGFWFEDTGVINADGTIPGFLLARAGRSNPKFAKATDAVGKKFKRQLDNDLLSNDKALEINRALFLDTILLGWRNVQPQDDGKELEFSRENADWLVGELPDLYELLELEAKKASNFREAETEELGKN